MHELLKTPIIILVIRYLKYTINIINVIWRAVLPALGAPEQSSALGYISTQPLTGIKL